MNDTLVWVAVVFGAVGIACAIWWNLGFRLGGKRYKDIDDLVRDVAGITGLAAEDGWYPKLEGIQFKGTLASGRRASIRFFTESVGSSTQNCVRIVVAADETPHLRVTQESLYTRFAKAVGLKEELEIGDEAFDRRFLLETTMPLKASRMLRPEVRTPISSIFDMGARDLTVANGEIVVTAPTSAIEPGDYARILDALDKAARTLDRKKLAVRILGGERRALVDDSGKTRCPYCRANVSGEEENLVACEKCKTVLHDGCWEEHGGCPLLGCGGVSPERARAR